MTLLLFYSQQKSALSHSVFVAGISSRSYGWNPKSHPLSLNLFTDVESGLKQWDSVTPPSL